MMKPRFSIGIDLGTTNCAISYLDLAEANSVSQAFAIPQLEERNTEVERMGLPSFLFRDAEPAERSEKPWVAGLFARNRGREIPDRVIHSAKSWLCHHAVSPESRILPWNSNSVAAEEKLSPIEASAQLLLHLRQAWERRMGDEAPFREQIVTVTVPASFDAAAQAATLEAAKVAGFPSTVRLLEEPQAAFYRWLEQAGESENLAIGQTVLVIDVGGGTSDFSLFRVEADGDGAAPCFQRIAVSDHLLLGGDNIDLALAHALESELAPDGGELSVDQWGFLISRARELKERCLGEIRDADETLSVSLPSKGSGLFGGTLSTEVSSVQVRELLTEGFFPICEATARVEQGDAGLLEWGLPYAADCAVTRHLAAFVAGKGRIDRVLFNGGSLAPVSLQERLIEQLAHWQGGQAPLALDNPETDLAVARGAACFGAVLEGRGRRIEAFAPRAVCLEVGKGEEPMAVCVLPKGAAAEYAFTAEVPGLSLKLNQKAQFRALLASDRFEPQVGDLCPLQGRDDFRSLPALEAEIEDDDGDDSRDRVAVRIVSSLNEVGLLTVSCEEIDGDGLWPLAFNLREDSGGAASASQAEAVPESQFAPEQLERARRLVRSGVLSEEKASRILKELEGRLRKKRHEWDLPTVRSLLDGCFEAGAALARAGDAAEAWLQLAGYFMRPGFGMRGDEERISRIEASLQAIPRLDAQLEVQWLVLWRRVAAGLDESRQAELFDGQLQRLGATKKAEAERIRLLGSLEKIDLGRKQVLFEELIARLKEGIAEKRHLSPLLAGCTALCARFLFHAGPDRVLPPETVVTLYKTLAKADWKDARLVGVASLFLSAARIVDDRSLNLPSRTTAKIASKLEKAGVAASRLAPLRDFTPVTKQDRVGSFGEALPPGLVLE